jgi:NDP-sugar pyrophosphorylase family protein
MILAAGLGTRLRPLTDDRPKALVEISGRTLLEITLSRLRSFGVREVIINVHHFADIIVEYLKTNDNFGMRIEVSREQVLLDTGGGLKKAAHFFVEDPSSEEPFIVHNVDVLSMIDLRRMVQFHTENQALATLAVQDRKTSRYLLFDDQLQLCGRRSGADEPELVQSSPLRSSLLRSSPVRCSLVRSAQQAHALAFSGIHVISPRFLTMMVEDGAFSIITPYLRLAAQGEKILAFRADEYYWRDLGKPENLAIAEQDLKQKIIAQ